MTSTKIWKFMAAALISLSTVVFLQQKQNKWKVYHISFNKGLKHYYVNSSNASVHIVRREGSRSNLHFHNTSRHKNQTECDYKIHMKTKKLRSDPSAFINGKSYIIYSCRSFCGGFGDQLRGITGAFTVAKHTGRLFRIEQYKPCDVTSFLIPSKQYNWNIDDYSQRNYSSCFVNTTIHAGTRNVSNKANDYLRYLNESVVYLQSNRMTRFWKSNFKNVFNTLFNYDTTINNELEHLKVNYVQSNKTVCAHLRVGKNKGFEDTDYNNLGNISAVWTFLATFDKPGYVIYIASDSEEVKASAKRRFRQRYIEHSGRVINTAYQADDESCPGYRKLILDFAFLSKCDILLLTYSNFGKYASELRDKPKDQFCFQFGKVYSCPVYTFQNNRRPLENEPLVI